MSWFPESDEGRVAAWCVIVIGATVVAVVLAVAAVEIARALAPKG